MQIDGAGLGRTRGRAWVGAGVGLAGALLVASCGDTHEFKDGAGGSAGGGGSASSGGSAGSAGLVTGDGGEPDDQAAVCEKNEPVCDGERATVCNANGTGYASGGVKCSSKQTCLAGTCQERECAAGEIFCSGDALRRCAADGLSSEETQACAEGEYCDAKSLSCKAGVCAPDQPSCDGNRATTCNAIGAGFLGGGTVCTAEQSCRAGGCVPHICVPGSASCQGLDVKRCAEDGLGTSVESTCKAQACVAVAGNASCQGDCAPGQKRCSGNGVQTCGANGSYGAAVACLVGAPQCTDGVCGQPPSCVGLAKTCGPKGEDSCCASSPVPAGSFNRSNDAKYPAKVGAFRLDNYEVSVGRFRVFVGGYSRGMIPAGAGKNPNVAGDPGWDTAWNASLPADATAFRAIVACDAAYQTFATGKDNLPVNCVNWFEAAAFCAWDGGRLPTEAEWTYAFSGGNEQRLYPWGATVPGADTKLAIYGCYYNSTSDCTGIENVAPVGTVPAGNGKWGQSDLAGGVYEFMLDWQTEPYAPASCDNCAVLTQGTATLRVTRGGNFRAPLKTLDYTWRPGDFPQDHFGGSGLRCARAQ